MLAKFKLVSKTFLENDYVSLKFLPVTDGSPENEQFWKYTPSGNLELTYIKSASAEAFEVCQEYYLDLNPAPRVATGAGL